MIFDDTTAYNHYFEGPGGRNLASFLHCFSRGLPGTLFWRLFDVFWRFGASGPRKLVSSTPNTSGSDQENPKLIKHN